MWGNAYQTNLEKIVLVQKRLIRQITGSPYRAHTEPLFVANKILTSKEINEFTIGVFIIKIKIVIYLKFFITIIKHTEICMVEKLEMLMLYMYHMRDLTSEELA